MRRTERLQGLRLMKFEEVYERTCRDVLSQVEAAEILARISQTASCIRRRNLRKWFCKNTLSRMCWRPDADRVYSGTVRI